MENIFLRDILKTTVIVLAMLTLLTAFAYAASSINDNSTPQTKNETNETPAKEVIQETQVDTTTTQPEDNGYEQAQENQTAEERAELEEEDTTEEVTEEEVQDETQNEEEPTDETQVDETPVEEETPICTPTETPEYNTNEEKTVTAEVCNPTTGANAQVKLSNILYKTFNAGSCFKKAGPFNYQEATMTINGKITRVAIIPLE
jgi:FtsZ-interacting cell division protein ZipA